jgi:hypothetical protein
MNLPEYQTIEVTADEERQLDGIHRQFLADMAQLTPELRSARASVLAGGIRKSNPLTRALAQQMVDVEKLNRQAEAAQKEIDFINSSRRRRGVDPSPMELARREVLQRQVEESRARQLGLLDNDFRSDRRKAVVEFRASAARHRKEARLAEAIAEQTAAAEEADVQARAAAVVRGKRLGLRQSNKAGEAQ